MKKIVSFLLAVLLTSLPFATFSLTVNATDVNDIASKHTYSNNGTTIPYRLILPDNYDANGNYPMLLFLHGAGERGNDNELQFFNCVQTIYDTMPEDCIIVVPQCPLQQQWVDVLFATGTYSTDSVPESNELKAVVEIVKQISTNYAVDTDRIYAAGLSMGGYGTWDLMVRHNDIFAAAIAICGGADASKADLLKYTPLFVFHGSADDTVPVSGSRNVVNAIKNLGGTLVEYTEFAGLGHGAWNPAFATTGLLDKLLACKLSDRYPAPETDSEGTIGGNKQNVALGATATVSGLETNDGTFSPSYAVDGDGATRVSFANDVDTQWLLLDLKQTYTVSSFEIAFKEHISEYEIQVSTDGKNFVSVYNLTGGTEQVTQTDKITLTTPVMARYVKYIQKKRWFYAPWNKYYSGGIYEFCVFTDSNSQGAQKYTDVIGTAKTFLNGTQTSDSRYAKVKQYSEQLEAYLKVPNAQVKVADGLYEAIVKAMNSESVTNLAYQKTYTTTGTYVVNGVVQYPDKNGNSMTDGMVAPADARYNHEAYMAFNKNSEDYKNNNFASITVDLGDNYFMDKFTAYVGSAFNQSVGIEAPSTVSVLVSTDNEKWTEVGFVTPQDVTNVSCIPATLQLVNSTYGRYVQFRFEGSVSWIFLSEVCVYEGEAYELPTEPEEPTYILGDVDDNGKVDSVDYLLVKRACFKTYDLSENEYIRANVNGDSLIDSTDYLLVKRIAFGTYIAQ